LTVGVAIVQLSGDGKEGVHIQEGHNSARNRFIGLVAVFCATITSGFAGVYFEKILKGSNTSLWIRNIQMGLPSVVIALATVYLEDRDKVYSKGFFVGYNRIVWAVVTIQAVGGLIVAVVVKYADNVLKVFATSFSIVFSCIMSAFMADFIPTLWFNIGASFVIISSIMYSKPDRRVRTGLHRSILPTTVTTMDPTTKRIS
jgi:UDP-sugar transporter A1/2/3